MFDAVQVMFNSQNKTKSPFANTRMVPFINSYFDILKAVVDDVTTEYFWFFSNFVDMQDIDLDFRPEQHEREQIHVWHTSQNKEGNVMLIPTKSFKRQMHEIDFLRDYKDINYHLQETIQHAPIEKEYFKLQDPLKSYMENKNFYSWLVNVDLTDISLPNFYPSFWEDEKMYTWGETKDILLVPSGRDLDQFYDIERHVHFDFDYKVKPMDIVFISYDEPGANDRFQKLKSKYPRAKWCKNIQGQTKAYQTAADMSETDYFFAVFPKIDVVDDFKFNFQPDRLKNPSHYIFDCYNAVIDCTYGHDGIILYNKKLVLETSDPGLDFTLSKPVTVVPILSALNKLEETPLLAWRTAFREVIKLKLQKPTVENNYRLKKWLTLGKGKNAQWVYIGAQDGVKFLNEGNDPYKSYDFDEIKNMFEQRYG
jgi:hypothetical protein